MKRRQFVKSSGILLGAGLTMSLSQPLHAKSIRESKYAETIGLQLWTVRDQLKKDAKGTLQAIAKAGYKQVELMDTEQLKTLLPICKDLGLKVTSSFFNWQILAKPDDKLPKIESIIEEAQKDGLKHLVFGYIGKGVRETVDHFKSHAEQANRAGEKCNQAGIKLCYHNHSFEFAGIGEGAQKTTGFDVLIDELDSDKCSFELDVFWAKIGGRDPFELMKSLKGRMTQVHLKDLKKGTAVCHDEGKVAKEAFEELGDGTINMKRVIRLAERMGVEQCHVEQDQSPDPLASVAQSIEHFRTLQTEKN